MLRNLYCSLVVVWCVVFIRPVVASDTIASATRPNIVFIMADDLGYGDLGCYGQKVLKTPNIDRLAAEGMRFTDHYAGHTVCRPSRLVLLTGQHTGHTAISANAPHVLPAGARTVTSLLKDAGYATGGVGKWALGGPQTTGAPFRQGFDFWYGYLDQGDAHNYFPEFLYRNAVREPLPGNRVGPQKRVSVARQTWSHDRLTEEALHFVREHADGRFLLQAHYTIPHANNEGGRATGNGMEVPDYGPFVDTDWPAPEEGFAAMMARLDADVGRLLKLLKELKIDRQTVVFFTSDNGPHQEGGHKMEFFDSNGALRGYKRDLYEGGIRVPLIVRWPGHIPAGSVTSHVSAFQDFLPTACELAGIEIPRDIDGLSYLPALLQKPQPAHEYLYWQYQQKAAVRKGNFKLVRSARDRPFELYDLSTDVGEQHDISGDHKQLVDELTAVHRQFAWQDLFDGRSLSGWRGYRQQDGAADGWEVRSGQLHCTGKGKTDLISVKSFENYELVVEWKTVPDGNSGVFVHASETTERLPQNAPEVQIYATGKRDPGPAHQAGALYGICSAEPLSLQPPLTWNVTRIVTRGPVIEVWHNGFRVCQISMASDKWKAKVASSKFARWPQFGQKTRGQIALQNHGSEVWFRSIRIRPLP